MIEVLAAYGNIYGQTFKCLFLDSRKDRVDYPDFLLGARPLLTIHVRAIVAKEGSPMYNGPMQNYQRIMRRELEAMLPLQLFSLVKPEIKGIEH